MIYDPFQKKAIGLVNDGYSVIVSAPTGSGKTAIAEHVIKECLKNGKKAVYTAPIKALSNQKFRDFHSLYTDKIGLLTGDVNINSHAPILIMTTEIFRNKLLEKDGSLEDYSWIIFDEVHYLDDYERGTVWEESLIFLPQHMRMLALSATIPNIDELAQWLSSIHKTKIMVVKEEKRPVPLRFFYQCCGEIVDNISKLRGFGKKHTRNRPHLKPNRPATLVKHLMGKDRLPCIYFSFGRRRCENLAEEMLGFDIISREDKRKALDLFDSLCAGFDLTGEKSAAAIRPFIEKGIAYHHAGMLPTLKEVMERLFTSRLIKIIFTTETFALGINMPARTVIFDELRKYYGRFHADLRTRDFYQMAGRAGRRSIDTEGFVYSRINPRYLSLNSLKEIIYGNPEKVKSRFNLSYAAILNLYNKYGKGLYDIYPLSFHAFRQKERYKKRACDLMRSKMDILKEFGLIKDDKLSEKGIFASNIYGYELILSELYSEGLLDQFSAAELAQVCLALIYEPRKGTHMPPLFKDVRRLKNITEDIARGVQKAEKRLGITPVSKSSFYHLSECLNAWMRGEEFDRILCYTDADEGGVIRYFRMCLQVLREILEAKGDKGLKDTARQAIHLINRGIVDAERQLGVKP